MEDEKRHMKTLKIGGLQMSSKEFKEKKRQMILKDQAKDREKARLKSIEI